MPFVTPQSTRAQVVVAAALALASVACSDGLTPLAPEVKANAQLTLWPDAARRGDPDALVLAVIPSPQGDAPPLITDFDVGGEDIALIQLDTGGGAGCQLFGIDAALDDLGIERATHYPVCLFLAIDPNAALGRRQVVLELTSDGAPLLARGSFTVLDTLTPPPAP